MRYRGLLYRSLEPIRAAEDPLSGKGAQKNGGRFNPMGVPALYTSMTPMTAIREANQVGILQPSTLVAYQADIDPVFDATREENLIAHEVNLSDLAADDWQNRMDEDGVAPTQAFAERLISMDYAGLKVGSFAEGASVEDVNVVLWKWGPDLPTQLAVNDDEGRLQRLSRNRETS